MWLFLILKYKKVNKFIDEFSGHIFDNSSWKIIKFKPQSYYKAFNVFMLTTWKNILQKKGNKCLGKMILRIKSFEGLK